MTISTAAFRYPEGRHAWGELRYHADLPVLTVHGSAEQLGTAIGTLALRHARRMAEYPQEMLRTFYCSWMAGPLLRLGGLMVERFPAEYRAEFEAITSASGVERGHMILGNTMFDIKKLVACSAFAVEPCRQRAQPPLLGRNLDYPSGGFAHEYTLATVYRPSGRKAFVSVGFPGLVGVLSGMNEDGLTVAILEVFQAPFRVRRLDPWGTPYALCFREILETCSTIDEAFTLLSRRRRTTMYNLALIDRHRAATFEVTPGRVYRRPAQHGVCLTTNHFQLDTLQPAFALNVMQTFDRIRTMRRYARLPRCYDVTSLHEVMHLVSAWDTLQTIIFEPEPLRLHLATGQIPASAGALTSVDLAPLFHNATDHGLTAHQPGESLSPGGRHPAMMGQP